MFTSSLQIPTTMSVGVLLVLCGPSALTGAQPNRCGEVLKVGIDEVDIASVVSEARDLYHLACQELGRRTGETSDLDLGVLFDGFDAGAKRNSSTLEEYRDRNCVLSENTVANYVSNNLRQRTINPAALDAWRVCVQGVNIVPHVFLKQTQVNFTVTRTSEREVTLRGIRSRHFSCIAYGDREITASGMNGEEMVLPRDVAVNIDCHRRSEPGEMGGRLVDVYSSDVLTLDLSTGAHNMEFVERHLGSAADEFAQLQEQVDTLRGELETVSGETIRECRVCFRETENSSQCQGARNTCSGWSKPGNTGDWSRSFRDDTDRRAGGCRYQWRLECR